MEELQNQVFSCQFFSWLLKRILLLSNVPWLFQSFLILESILVIYLYPISSPLAVYVFSPIGNS